MELRTTFDFETQSAADLKRCGSFEYSMHPTTRALCLAFKERGGPVEIFTYDTLQKPWHQLNERLRKRWMRYICGGYLFSAHNAYFDFCIYTNVLVNRLGWPRIHPTMFRCTAAKAAACNLPRSLEGAGSALRLTTQKDKAGYIAMMLLCRPTKHWTAWKNARLEVKAGKNVGPRKRSIAEESEPKQFHEYQDCPDQWSTLYKYCKTDVITQELLDIALPDLTPTEQEVWFLNQKINWRGIRIDIPTCRKVVDIMNVNSKKKLSELDALTMGLVTKAGARKSILEFLAMDGIELPDIRAKTVEDALKSGKLTEDGKALLEIRKALSKTSTKKYQSFIDRAGEKDFRVRDFSVYHGAHTGRDSNTGAQLQNLSKRLISQAAVDDVIEALQ